MSASSSSSARGVDRTSAVSRWLRANPDARTRKNDEATHLLLSGGLARVEDEPAFLRLLADDMKHGRANYVVEHRTETFKLCQDYDFLSVDERGIDEATFLRYMASVVRVVWRLFPDTPEEHRRVIICTAPTKRVEKDVALTNRVLRGGTWTVTEPTRTERMMLTKTGFHAIFPHLFVSRDIAMTVRYVLLQHCKTEFGASVVQRRHLNDTYAGHADESVQELVYDRWEDILDVTIYRANGLRMLGSSKAEKCKSCRRADRSADACAECDDRGYIDCGRPYRVHSVLDETGQMLDDETRRLQADHVAAMTATSIRSQQTMALATLVLPRWFSLQAELATELSALSNSAGRRKYRRVSARDPDAIAGGNWGAAGSTQTFVINNRNIDFLVLDPGDPRFIVFDNFLRDSVGAQQAVVPVRVVKMILSADASTRRIYAVVNNKYCANVGRAHNSQDVYFVLLPRIGLVQRCWSTGGTEGRAHGPCRSAGAVAFFNERAVKVPTSVIRQLFPPPPASSSTTTTLPPTTTVSLLPQQRLAPGNRHPGANAKLQSIFESMYLRWHTSSNKLSWFSDATCVVQPGRDDDGDGEHSAEHEEGGAAAVADENEAAVARMEVDDSDEIIM